MKLTKTRIDALEPTGKDTFIWDDALPGYGIRMSPKGLKSYVVQYRWEGQSKRIAIGRTNMVTADQARKAAKIILGDVSAGKSPSLEAQRSRKTVTLARAAERFMDEHVKIRLKPSTQSDYRHNLKKYILPILGTRHVTGITYKDVHDLHHSLKDTPTQANRTISLLSKLLSLCERWGWRENSSNPCANIERFKEGRRHRFLDQDELARLWATLDTAPQLGLCSVYAASAYKLLILTGCRLGEIRTLKWSYVKGSRIEFPDSKTGYKRLPLSEDVLHVLEDTPRMLDNEYVICGHVAGQPIINLQKSWRRILEKANLSDVRIHDLRHTFASQAVMGGTPLAIMSKLLGHSNIATTMRYAHLADSELKNATDDIASSLRPAIRSTKDKGTVVRFDNEGPTLKIVGSVREHG